MEKEDDMNPMTLRLDQLIPLIDAGALSLYLGNVVSFLQYGKNDLWFPKLSPDLDAFLVKVIREEENLRGALDLFNKRCRMLAEEILVLLKENKDVFKVVHSHTSSQSDKNTLVYKKVFATKRHGAAVTQQIYRICPKPAPLAEASIATSPPEWSDIDDPGFRSEWLDALERFVTSDDDNMEFPSLNKEEAHAMTSWLARGGPAQLPGVHELGVSQLRQPTDTVRVVEEKAPLEGDPPIQPHNPLRQLHDFLNTKVQKSIQRKKEMVQKIEPSFTRTALNIILEFINNPTEASIIFKNANEEQSAFLQSACAIARCRKTQEALPLDSETRALLRRVAAALDAARLYELRIDVSKMERETKLRTVSIIKYPKENMTPPKASKKPDNPASKKSDDAGAGSAEAPSASNKELGFKPTPSTSSDHQPDINVQSTQCKGDPESKTIDKNTKAMDDFINKVKNISNAISRDNARVSTSTMTDCTKNNAAGNAKSKDKATANPIVNAKQKSAKIIDKSEGIRVTTNAAVYTKTKDAMIIENTKAKDNARANPTAQVYAEDIDQARSMGRSHSYPKQKERFHIAEERARIEGIMRRNHVNTEVTQLNASINTQRLSGGAAGASGANEPRGPVELSDGRPMPARKVKLIEAMSVPMESDRAMRMMRQMGWEGGPLGTRGEGITEPIMPALHIAAGAGLGHVRPRRDPPRSGNFHMDVLHHILQLLQGSAPRKTVTFPALINKKDRAYLLTAVRALSRRSTLRTSDEPLQALVLRVAAELERKPRMQVAAVLHEDKRSVTLSKLVMHEPAVAAEPTQAPSAEAVLAAVGKYLRGNHLTAEVSTQIGVALGSGSLKAAKGLGHRLALLARVLELLRGARHELALTFEFPLTLKQTHFIRETVAAINLRGKIKYGTFENYLSSEILRAVGDTVLALEIGSTHRSMILKKKHHHHSKKNSAKDAKNNNKVGEANNNTTEANKNAQPGTSKDVVCDYAVPGCSKDDDDYEEDYDIIVGSSKAETASAKAKEIKKSKINSKVTKERAIAKCDSKVIDKEANSDVIVISSDDDSTDAEDGDNEAKDLDVSDKEDESSLESSEVDVLQSPETATNVKKDSVIKNDEVHPPKNIPKKLQIPKYLCIAPDSYPIHEVDAEMIGAFQKIISEKITNKEKPLIECVGLKNGALIYGCHNENGIKLIESVAIVMDLKTTNITNLYKDKKLYKVSARINSYMKIDLKVIFDKIEEYNKDLKTDSWNITDVQRNEDSIQMVIEIDGYSFDYISHHGFALFAGTDKVRFNVIWN